MELIGCRFYVVLRLLRFRGKTSGLASWRNRSRAFGIPRMRHCETDGWRTWQRSATALVPPSLSIRSDGFIRGD